MSDEEDKKPPMHSGGMTFAELSAAAPLSDPNTICCIMAAAAEERGLSYDPRHDRLEYIHDGYGQPKAELSGIPSFAGGFTSNLIVDAAANYIDPDEFISNGIVRHWTTATVIDKVTSLMVGTAYISWCKNTKGENTPVLDLHTEPRWTVLDTVCAAKVMSLMRYTTSKIKTSAVSAKATEIYNSNSLPSDIMSMLSGSFESGSYEQTLNAIATIPAAYGYGHERDSKASNTWDHWISGYTSGTSTWKTYTRYIDVDAGSKSTHSHKAGSDSYIEKIDAITSMNAAFNDYTQKKYWTYEEVPKGVDIYTYGSIQSTIGSETAFENLDSAAYNGPFDWLYGYTSNRTEYKNMTKELSGDVHAFVSLAPKIYIKYIIESCAGYVSATTSWDPCVYSKYVSSGASEQSGYIPSNVTKSGDDQAKVKITEGVTYACTVAAGQVESPLYTELGTLFSKKQAEITISSGFSFEKEKTSVTAKLGTVVASDNPPYGSGYYADFNGLLTSRNDTTYITAVCGYAGYPVQAWDSDSKTYKESGAVARVYYYGDLMSYFMS